MLLNYTMFINTHYTADVDLFLHHGSVISVLMLLSVITVISNRYKTAKVQKEEIPVEVTAVDSNA